MDEISKRVIVSRDVIFDKTNFDMNGNTITVETSTEETTTPTVKEDDERAMNCRSERSKKPPVRYGLDEYESTHYAFNASEIQIPESFKDVIDPPFSKQWKEASDLEYKSLIQNGLVKLPNDKILIGC